MIVKLLLLLSLISAIASMKFKSSINARFGFCFFALFSSLLPLAFEKFLAFISHLLLLGMFAPTSIALLEDKFKVELRAGGEGERGARTSVIAALTTLLVAFLLFLRVPTVETALLSATAVTGLYGALLARPLVKRFFGILIIEGCLSSWLGALANAGWSIASPILIFSSILAMLYTANLIFKGASKHPSGGRRK